jgi:hypothetical protein
MIAARDAHEIMWLGAVFSVMSLPRLYDEDYEDVHWIASFRVEAY